MSLDVIVVGAGPAGSTAARVLAESGARVTILEKHTFPRQKPCGGAISVRALARFPEVAAALPQISTHYISRLILEGPGRTSTTIESKDPVVLMIRRIEFDHLLARLACRAGAELVEGVEVTQASDKGDCIALQDRRGRRFEAKFVIAADGVNSVVARRLGLNTGWRKAHLALDMMEETPNEELRACEPDAIWVAYGPGGSHGYSYIFPKRDHVNVGTGCLLSYFQSRPAKAGHYDSRTGYRDSLAKPYDMQTRLVESLVRRGFLRGASNRRHFMPFLIPVGGPLKTTGLDRVLVAGDAGGFVNGYTAEGIYYAMLTGELAARAVASDRAAPLDAYAAAWRREIGAELRDAVLVQRFLFGSPDRVDRIVTGADTNRDLVEGLLDYAIGRASYAGTRRQLIFNAPTFIPRLLWAAIKTRDKF